MSGLRRYIERGQPVLRAVCQAFLPHLSPGPGDNAELFRLSADELSVLDAVEEAQAAFLPRQMREFRLFLELLDNPVFLLVATGRFARFTSLSQPDAEAALRRMATHPVPQIRSGYNALRRLATFLFYAVAKDDAPNPTWAAIGYSLPGKATPPASVPPLRATIFDRSTTLEADVCVIGSGAGGGVVAAALAAAGKTVVVLEAGVRDQAAEYDQREVTGMSRLHRSRGTVTNRDASMTILAGVGLGGGTSINWQTSLRTPDWIRDEWAERSGLRLFADAQYTAALDAVCARLSVGTGESWRNANNETLARGCTALGYEWRETPRNARGCDRAQCGFCGFGCRAGGKQSTANTYLRDAMTTGRATIAAECRVRKVLIEGGRAVGVAGSAWTGDNQLLDITVRARRVVVAAGALETPALLARSGVSHPELGRNLWLHPTAAVAGRYSHPIRGWDGPPQTVVCTQFARVDGNYGYHMETAPVHPGLIALSQPWFGARDHRQRMQQAANVAAFIVLARDRHPGRVVVDRSGLGAVEYAPGRAEQALLRHGMTSAARAHWAAGAEEVLTLHARPTIASRGDGDIESLARAIAEQPVASNWCALFSAHQMGTCRIGADRRRSVCGPDGQVWGVPGLHVADASLFPASSGVNPMVTVMALAQVVADSMSS